MFRIKRLYLFILQTFLPVFLMTFFICLFIVLMQFLWKYVDEMVGKGLEISVLLELFFYAAVSMVPMSLPLALLLASLMTFGNLGERLELLAIKAAGVSLIHIMRPLVVVISFIAIGAFFFQNDILPKSQVKLWSLLYSMRQKSPELDIPEGVFYDQIQDFNLFVKKKDRKTGMLRDVMIYDMSKGFDDAMVILADSGKLKLTEDKQYLFLTLYNGESFENLKSQRAANENVPYRRETFSLKEILIAFDSNFNRMDEGIMQNQYIGKDMQELRSSIDSLNQRTDSLGREFGKSLQRAGYFSIYDSKPAIVQNEGKKAMVKAPIGALDIDSLYKTFSAQKQQLLLDRAVARAEQIYQENEYKGYVMSDEKRVARRHEIEMHKKFTLSFACLIFFFIGAPLGAIIRKGGLGMPVVVSVLLFIFYYIIDNTGYKLARDGRWEVWEGMWLSSAVLLPLGIFLTYKAVNDSAVFNSDAYANFFKKLFGKQEIRKLVMKEVVMEEVVPERLKPEVEELTILCDNFFKEYGTRNQSYWVYWTRGYDLGKIRQISIRLENLVEYASNSQDQLLLSKLMDYPILRHLIVYRVTKRKWIGILAAILLPIAIPIYIVGAWQQKRLRRDLQLVLHTNREVIAIISGLQKNDK